MRRITKFLQANKYLIGQEFEKGKLLIDQRVTICGCSKGRPKAFKVFMASVSSLASQGLEMEGWKHVRSPLSISSTQQSCNSSYSAEDAPHAPVVCDKAALCEKEPLARSQPTVPRSAPGLGLDIGADQAHPTPCSGCSVRDVSWVLLACSRNNYSAGIGMIPSR